MAPLSLGVEEEEEEVVDEEAMEEDQEQVFCPGVLGS
jgi:hypothetical protein